MKLLFSSLSLLFLMHFSIAFGQKYSEVTLRQKLDSTSTIFKGYSNKVQLNVSGLPLYELINSIALENNLNITVDPGLNETVSYNFFDAQVKDVLVYVYDHFSVEYKFVGSILSIVKRASKKEVPLALPQKPADIKYNPSNQFLSVDLKNDSLYHVMKTISTLTGNNIVIAPDVKDKAISGYFLNRPFKQVMEMIVRANGLESSEDEDGITYVYTDLKGERPSIPSTFGYKSSTSFDQAGVAIKKNPFGTLDIIANNADYSDIIRAAANELKIPYFIYDKLEGKSTFEVQDATFESLLKLLFTGTKYAYREEDRLFLIGELKSEGIRVTETVKMQNRTVENVKNAIPTDLTIDLEIKEFEELNALILTGPVRKVNELKQFLETIDVIVPMVQIDVMILLSDRSSTVSAGLKLGLGDKPTTTSGSVFPGVSIEAGAQTINRILSAINGFGIVNLGAVTENFYASLSLLESNGTLEVESTPKITTLSSHLATVSIGQTTYYQETRVDVQNSVVNQGVLSSKIWKSIDANLTVKIKPFVSTDGTVTMSITLTNDDFDGGAKVDPSAPPNIVKQTFESVIRVHDGDVVLLGGLDKKSNNNTGEGFPGLSRIPVIKWLFSKRTKTKSKYKLHIILRPIVTY